MTEKTNKTKWNLNTQLVYTSVSGQKWQGEVVDVDFNWRKVRWADGVTSWFQVERLNANAKPLRATQIDHTKCGHEATPKARRACRKAIQKLASEVS